MIASCSARHQPQASGRRKYHPIIRVYGGFMASDALQRINGSRQCVGVLRGRQGRRETVQAMERQKSGSPRGRPSKSNQLSPHGAAQQILRSGDVRRRGDVFRRRLVSNAQLPWAPRRASHSVCSLEMARSAPSTNERHCSSVTCSPCRSALVRIRASSRAVTEYDSARCR